MEVYEKINCILKQKNLTKRWFAKRLRELEPKLKSTGEIPTEKAIYGYLNGVSQIKIELIPCIADVLNISESELFTFNKDEKKNSFTIRQPKVEYGSDEKELEKLVCLLPYSPKILVKKLINELESIKKLYDEI